jgi:6-phosphogluconolactonase
MVRIFHDLESLSLAAKDAVITIANAAVAERGRFLIALNGGGTPKRLFELLANTADEMDWPRAHVFWGDERCVPADDPESSYGLAKRLLLDHVPVSPANIHRINTDLSAAEAVDDYSAVLGRYAFAPHAWPRFDLVLLGMGDDGHTASLFPGSPVENTKPVIEVSADYQGRPARRISLTPLVFNDALDVFFMAAGASKADALERVLNGDSEVQFPAARIHPTKGTITWFVDEAAARKL